VRTILVIQNDLTDPPALVGAWLEAAGATLRVIEAFNGEVVPNAVPADVDAVLPLGGAIGANDDDVAPWLVAERALLADAVDRGIPVLGICLGGQLLAASTGGRVGLATNTEVGVYQISIAADQTADPVFGAMAATSHPTAQWHQDEVLQLPPAATVLASSAACEVQIFGLGANTYGLQFHPEVDSEVFFSWLDEADEALNRSGKDGSLIKSEFTAAETQLTISWRAAVERWFSHIPARSTAV